MVFCDEMKKIIRVCLRYVNCQHSVYTLFFMASVAYIRFPTLLLEL